MILRLQILWLLLLSACGTLPSAPEPRQLSDTAPTHWQASGRLSVTQNDGLSSYRFHLKVRQQDFELRLSDALGLSQIQIERQSGQLLVNQQPAKQSFKDWSMLHLGWYLSPAQLASIVFTDNIHLPDWQISINQYQQLGQVVRPKLLQLEQQGKGLTIKLLFSDINS